MNLLESKIEKIQKKPEFERRRIFWRLIFIFVPLVLILGIYLIFLSFNVNTQKENISGNNINMNSLENLFNDSQKSFLNVKDSLNGLKSIYSTSSSSVLPDSSSAPQNSSEENKVYFISPAPSAS
jgi:ABC-type maltose transport system permease subunit